MRGALPNTDQPRIPRSEYWNIMYTCWVPQLSVFVPLNAGYIISVCAERDWTSWSCWPWRQQGSQWLVSFTRVYTLRNTRDRCIIRSLQKWVLVNISISHVEVYFSFFLFNIRRSGGFVYIVPLHPLLPTDPSRKGCVVNGQTTKASNNVQLWARSI